MLQCDVDLDEEAELRRLEAGAAPPVDLPVRIAAPRAPVVAPVVVQPQAALPPPPPLSPPAPLEQPEEYTYIGTLQLLRPHPDAVEVKADVIPLLHPCVEAGVEAKPPAKKRKASGWRTVYACTKLDCGWFGDRAKRHSAARKQCTATPHSVLLKEGRNLQDEVQRFVDCCTQEERERGLAPSALETRAALQYHYENDAAAGIRVV